MQRRIFLLLLSRDLFLCHVYFCFILTTTMNCVIFYKPRLFYLLFWLYQLRWNYTCLSLSRYLSLSLPVSTTFLLNGSLNVQINVKPLCWSGSHQSSGRYWVGGFQLWWGFFLSACFLFVSSPLAKRYGNQENNSTFFPFVCTNNQIIRLLVNCQRWFLAEG